jgi:hypothetical protein
MARGAILGGELQALMGSGSDLDDPSHRSSRLNVSRRGTKCMSARRVFTSLLIFFIGFSHLLFLEFGTGLAGQLGLGGLLDGSGSGLGRSLGFRSCHY